MNTSTITSTITDPHEQLRALYHVLLSRQECFDEFKSILSLYELRQDQVDDEPPAAREARDRLNESIRGWVGGRFDGLSVAQMLQWRAILIEERLNVALSPWKESNFY